MTKSWKFQFSSGKGRRAIDLVESKPRLNSIVKNSLVWEDIAMERPKNPRVAKTTKAQTTEPRRREVASFWASPSVYAGAAALGLCTVAGFLIYRYFRAAKTPKKTRSKHSKKVRKSKKQDVVEEEPELRNSGAASPRGPSRPDSPVAAPKSVPDSSRQDQFAWWKEIATDQFEARKTDHAQYYAKKALDLAASIPFVQETTSFQQLRFIMVAGIADPEARTRELQSYDIFHSHNSYHFLPLNTIYKIPHTIADLRDDPCLQYS